MNTFNADFNTILIQAATSSVRPTSAVMIEALQIAETTARVEKLVIPFEALLGEWRLCFATGAKKSKQRRGIVLGKGYYLPKFTPASITFTRDRISSTMGTATNQLQVGGLKLKFTGPCRYSGKKNLLVFDFTEIEVKLFGKTVYQGKIRSAKTADQDFEQLAIAKLPFFAFFWTNPHGIAARGRGGGLALWIRD